MQFQARTGEDRPFFDGNIWAVTISSGVRKSDPRYLHKEPPNLGDMATTIT
jgi:hypothetical protein